MSVASGLDFYGDIEQKLKQLEADGLYKHERVITTPQGSDIGVKDGSNVLNFCANNYCRKISYNCIIRN